MGHRAKKRTRDGKDVVVSKHNNVKSKKPLRTTTQYKYSSIQVSDHLIILVFDTTVFSEPVHGETVIRAIAVTNIAVMIGTILGVAAEEVFPGLAALLVVSMAVDSLLELLVPIALPSVGCAPLDTLSRAEVKGDCECVAANSSRPEVMVIGTKEKVARPRSSRSSEEVIVAVGEPSSLPPILIVVQSLATDLLISQWIENFQGSYGSVTNRSKTPVSATFGSSVSLAQGPNVIELLYVPQSLLSVPGGQFRRYVVADASTPKTSATKG